MPKILTGKEKQKKEKLNAQVHNLCQKKRPKGVELSHLPCGDTIPTLAKKGILSIETCEQTIAFLKEFKP